NSGRSMLSGIGATYPEWINLAIGGRHVGTNPGMLRRSRGGMPDKGFLRKTAPACRPLAPAQNAVVGAVTKILAFNVHFVHDMFHERSPLRPRFGQRARKRSRPGSGGKLRPLRSVGGDGSGGGADRDAADARPSRPGTGRDGAA